MITYLPRRLARLGTQVVQLSNPTQLAGQRTAVTLGAGEGPQCRLCPVIPNRFTQSGGQWGVKLRAQSPQPQLDVTAGLCCEGDQHPHVQLEET